MRNAEYHYIIIFSIVLVYTIKFTCTRLIIHFSLIILSLIALILAYCISYFSTSLEFSLLGKINSFFLILVETEAETETEATV